MTGTPANCNDILTGISSYLDGELEATACEAIERHCQECPSCAALVSGLRQTIGLCRHAGSAPLPDAVRQRARESVRRLLDRHRNES
jgi:anti-sigma factor RsiW